MLGSGQKHQEAKGNAALLAEVSLVKGGTGLMWGGPLVLTG